MADERPNVFQLMDDFITHKRAAGYQYRPTSVNRCANLARFLDERARSAPPDEPIFGKEAALEWVALRDGESRGTREARIGVARQFAMYLLRMGYEDVHILPVRVYNDIASRDFVPYVFTHDEIDRVSAAFDGMRGTKRSPKSHVVYPAMFRVFYCCGLRTGEVSMLTVRDTDLENGVINVRGSKNGDSRYVPMSDSLVCFLRGYVTAAELDVSAPTAPFFPSPKGGHLSKGTIERVFAKTFAEAGVKNQRGVSPRVVDLRHTFAVHSLQRAGELGIPERVFLPTLAAYMGHKKIRHTEMYLHLTLEGQARTVAAMDDEYPDLYPEVIASEW